MAKLDSSDLLILLQKHLNGEINAEEEIFLRKYFDHFEMEADITQQLPQEELNRLKREIKAGIEEKIGKTASVISIHRVRRWYKLAAAIIIVLLAGSLIWFGTRNTRPRSAEIVQESVANDILPANGKVTLTLGDGSTVMLDSLTNRERLRQGESQLINENSQLTYLRDRTIGSKVPVQINTVSTQKGARYGIVLSDGTRVWLNAASSLRFPSSFSGNERKVELTGEAYFEVSYNPGKPFRVWVNDVKVEVLGTHFNINGYADEKRVSTTLLEGVVRVSKGLRDELLAPGQQAVVSENGRIILDKEVNIKEVMAWKDGKFYLKSASLESIMRQVARWYDVEVVYENPVQEKYTLSVKRDVPVSKLLSYIEMNGGVHFKIDGKKIIVR